VATGAIFAKAADDANSRGEEFYGYQGAMLDPRLYIVIDTAFLMNGRDNRTSSGLIQNGRRPGWQVRLYTLLEVEGELGVREQVGIPGAASGGSSRDVHLSLNMVEPYLDAAGLPGFPASGGDVDHAALFQCVLYLRIHTSSPVALPCVSGGILCRIHTDVNELFTPRVVSEGWRE